MPDTERLMRDAQALLAPRRSPGFPPNLAQALLNAWQGGGQALDWLGERRGGNNAIARALGQGDEAIRYGVGPQGYEALSGAALVGNLMSPAEDMRDIQRGSERLQEGQPAGLLDVATGTLGTLLGPADNAVGPLMGAFGGLLPKGVGAGSVPDVARATDDAMAGGYRGLHTAPGRAAFQEEAAASLDDLTRIYPDDIYSPRAAQFYGHTGGNDPIDRGTVRIIQKMRGNPDATVTVYRAVPQGVNDSINSGDWVTINRDYAKGHGEGPLGGNYRIVEMKVRAGDLFTDGNSIHEFGFDPQK